MKFDPRPAALLALFMMAAAPISAQAQAAPASTVTIAAEDDWAPYSSSSGNLNAPAAQDQPEGFAVDLVRAAFAVKGIKVEFLLVPFTRCMRYAETGRAAGCFNATITADNETLFHWHAPPMFEEELSIFARADASGEARSLSDLKGRTVGYTNGYTYPSAFMQDASIRKFGASSDQYLLRMLISGRVDYILLNRTPGDLRINASAEFAGKAKRVGRLSLDSFWVAFSKTHPDGQRMAELFGQGLSELRRNGSYQRMLNEFRRKLGYR
jgi:polar amino acid transport system substrate-binding protein